MSGPAPAQLMTQRILRGEVLVSVVLPVFNGEATIADAMQSALSQSEGRLELIVVDDGSTDGTGRLIERIASEDDRVRLLRLGCNQGPSAARNAGFAAATGTWIATLDADDWYLPERLAQLILIAHRTGVEMVSDNLLVRPERDAEHLLIPAAALPRERTLSLAEFILGNAQDIRGTAASYGFLQPMIRRDFVERFGLKYDKRNRFGEDFIFYVQCLRAGARWLMLPRAFYVYALSATSLSHQQRASDLRRIERLDLDLLQDPVLSRSAGLVRAVQLHRAAIRRLQRYRVVTDALKRKRFRRAFVLLRQDARTPWLVAREALRQMPTIIAKAWRGGYGLRKHLTGS